MKRTAQTYIAQHESGEEIAASLVLYIRDRNKLQLIAQLLNDHLAPPPTKKKRGEFDALFEQVVAQRRSSVLD